MPSVGNSSVAPLSVAGLTGFWAVLSILAAIFERGYLRCRSLPVARVQKRAIRRYCGGEGPRRAVVLLWETQTSQDMKGSTIVTLEWNRIVLESVEVSGCRCVKSRCFYLLSPRMAIFIAMLPPNDVLPCQSGNTRESESQRFL